jgi:hypothetical protein
MVLTPEGSTRCGTKWHHEGESERHCENRQACKEPSLLRKNRQCIEGTNAERTRQLLGLERENCCLEESNRQVRKGSGCRRTTVDGPERSNMVLREQLWY